MELLLRNPPRSRECGDRFRRCRPSSRRVPSRQAAQRQVQTKDVSWLLEIKVYKKIKNGPGTASGKEPCIRTHCCPTTCDPIIFCGMPQNATMLRSPQMRSKKDSSPGEGSRQVFWLVPTATPSQFHHGISGLRRVAVRLRDLQQRELLPILTAFPFHRAEAPPAPLRTLM